ncbi:restriction endonuclease [Chitinophaga oryzae]|uniref:Restriction endonuclease n=1 Tax=Chitinophaga oryzae TaxID=2725414 RepID=A0ABX6LNU1_9BACT|nr:restriction endonuclease [Chitinophaga oryzae]QJB41713.1 restriction endonuclease [Chitinophaga oryzae]
MNTKAKGDTFENRVYDLILDSINRETFNVPVKNFKIYKNKKYLSKDQSFSARIDISIESYRKGAEHPSLYIFIECKDYNSAVGIDKIKKFNADVVELRGIGLNAKGIFITKSAVQEGLLNYARSNGIAVVRVMDDDTMDTIVERKEKNSLKDAATLAVINVFNALTHENFVSTTGITYAFYKDKPFTRLTDLLKEITSG